MCDANPKLKIETKTPGYDTVFGGANARRRRRKKSAGRRRRRRRRERRGCILATPNARASREK